MKLTESHIHVAMRRHLKKDGWKLVAGQYPGGSDDELYCLNITDPRLAKDGSPDPRRHSLNKIVPDLLAVKDNTLIIVEAKPNYSEDDFEKLQDLLGNRRVDLFSSLIKFSNDRAYPEISSPGSLKIVPCLAFGYSKKQFRRDESFAYIIVEALDLCSLDMPI